MLVSIGSLLLCQLLRALPDVEYQPERSAHHASYLPAQEDPAQEGARLPQENEDRERPQGSRSPQSKGQSKAQLLITLVKQVKA